MKNNTIIAMDVDGTLLNDEKKISPKTKESLLKIQEAGATLILASGRPLPGVVSLAKELNMHHHHGLLVAYNGSKVVDCQTQDVLFNDPISIADGKAVLNYLKNFEGIQGMIDKDDYMYVENVYNGWIEYRNKPFNVIEYEARNGGYKLSEVDDLADFLDYPINKILTTGNPETLKKLHPQLIKPFEDRLTVMFTADFYFEYTARGVDKAKALGQIFKLKNIDPKNMLAFGDGHNDLTMLQYAGIGIAMNNAVEELKNAADYITLSNNEDGIAHSIEKYLL